MGSTTISKKEKGYRIFLSEKDLEQFGANDVPQTVIKKWILKGKQDEFILEKLEELEHKQDEFINLSVNFYHFATYVLGTAQYDIELIRTKPALRAEKLFIYNSRDS